MNKLFLLMNKLFLLIKKIIIQINESTFISIYYKYIYQYIINFYIDKYILMNNYNILLNYHYYKYLL